MALAYIRISQHQTMVRKERLLVVPGKVNVKVGDTVTAKTLVAVTELDRGEPLKVQVASFFSVEASDIGDLMQVEMGDSVKEGEILAQRRQLTGRKLLRAPCSGLIELISLSTGEVHIRERQSADQSVIEVPVAKELGISARFLKSCTHVQVGDEVNYHQILASFDRRTIDAVRSPTRGSVERIDTRRGTISIRKPYSPTYAYAYISGQVVEVIPHRGVVIETPASYVQGVFGVGQEAHGELVVLTTDCHAQITHELITPDHADKVIVGGSGITFEAMKQAIRCRVRGVVVGGLHNYDVVRLIGREVSVGITGYEDLDTTFIATEGFGKLSMLEGTFNLLKNNQGKMTSINGTTQIRAGVIRPEIIIPQDQDEDALVSWDEKPLHETVEPKTGMKVRILSDPHFGKWGTIVRDQTVDTLLTAGMRMPTVLVRLEDGTEVEMLENNLVVYEVGV